MSRPPARAVLCPLFCFLVLSLNGCELIGVAAYKLKPPETIQPKYMGLEHQTVGVMGWADQGLRIEWSPLQVDLANAIQTKLTEFQKAGKRESKTLVGTSFPVLPNSIIRYQRDHPEIDAMPIEEVAPKLTVNRLIFVELQRESGHDAKLPAGNKRCLPLP